MIKMKKWIISIIVFVLIVGGGVTAYAIFKNKNEQAGAPVTETQTAVAELGNVEVNVSGTGSISTINNEVILSEENNAVVEEVLVEVGDTVEEGDDLITFEDDDIDPIEAPFSGEITTLNVEAEDMVSMGAELIEVTDYSNLQMVVNVDELDISKVKVGQTAQIDVSALPDQEFTGTVTSVSKEANESESSVAQFAVNVKINEPTGIKVGMTAEATITTESKENVLTVPVSAVQKQGDEYYVLVKADEASTETTETTEEQNQQGETGETAKEDAAIEPQTTQKTVEVGLQNEEVAEITSGLSEGEEIVLPTLQSSSDDEGGTEDMRDRMMQGGFPGGDMPSGGMPSGNMGGNRGGAGQ